MIHEEGLVATIAIGLASACLAGFLATRFGLPSLLGYLLAGVALGPFSPGFVANSEVAHELAEIGVVLLMFGVGLHFSLADLLAVKWIALATAMAQIVVATAIGAMLALAWGWGLAAGLVLGIAISIASTVVLLRALMDRGVMDSVHGRVSVAVSLVQDLVTVLVLVLLPAIASALLASGQSGSQTEGIGGVLLMLAVALGKLGLLTALMLVGGTRLVPWILVQAARTGSRELFTLTVVAIALGISFASAMLFGASFALGAFLAGVVISESDLSHQAAAEALPLRDAFAVLFFVSVGMLFDPAFLLAEPGKLLAVLAVVVVARGLSALVAVAAFGYPLRTGLIVSVGLAQIGEFSFILAELGTELGLLPTDGRSLILGTAILSIMLNPFLFRAVDPLERWLRARPRFAAALERRAGALSAPPDGPESHYRGHVVICGYSGVARLLTTLLDRRGFSYIVIDQNRRQVEELRYRGVLAIYGDAGNPLFLEHAALAHARVLVIAFNDPLVTPHIVAQARRLNPQVRIVARAQTDVERATLIKHEVDDVVLGDLEVAAEIARYTLHRFGVTGAELQSVIQGLRSSSATL